MKIIERSVQEIGKSLLVSLPKEWTKVLKIRKGQKVKLMVGEQGTLTISPEFVELHERKETIIPYDENFERRFFREYFEGNDKITITIKSMSDKERAEIFTFFKRFMNVQVIDERKDKIVIRCFKINELSIPECLQRMHFLALSMMSEVSSPSPKIQESRDTMSRFYYMLVMQIRRYLSEGKYVESDRIPLILAMDYRMVAEKIQRISHLLAEIKKADNDAIAIVHDYYEKSMQYFFSHDYDKALHMWHEYDLRKKELEKSCKNDHVFRMMRQILIYSKEISMLVR
jgi:phosphate uptake regulator